MKEGNFVPYLYFERLPLAYFSDLIFERRDLPRPGLQRGRDFEEYKIR